MNFQDFLNNYHLSSQLQQLNNMLESLGIYMPMEFTINELYGHAGQTDHIRPWQIDQPFTLGRFENTLKRRIRQNRS